MNSRIAGQGPPHGAPTGVISKQATSAGSVVVPASTRPPSCTSSATRAPPPVDSSSWVGLDAAKLMDWPPGGDQDASSLAPVESIKRTSAAVTYGEGWPRRRAPVASTELRCNRDQAVVHSLMPTLGPLPPQACPYLQQSVVQRVAAQQRLARTVKALQLHLPQLIVLVNGQQLLET